MANQRSFSLEFKRQAVQELLSGEGTAAKVCRRYNIGSGLLYHWKTQYLKGKFGNEGDDGVALKDRVEKLERLVGKLTLENEFLKKGLQSSLSQSQRDGRLSPDVREQLQIIEDGSQRVKEIIKRMLTFARQSKPVKSLVDITELIENTLALRAYVLKTANIEVAKEYERDLPWLTIDASQMQQVFLNIIVNAEFAMKNSHGRGKLSVKVATVGDTLRITFSDDGPGMSKETLDKLFQPFFTTKEPGEGTGLGLSLSRSIILEHGGEIKAESEPGQGTIFTITLPITGLSNLERGFLSLILTPRRK